MLEISGKTNLLEQNAYKYSLQDVAEPNLQRDIYTQGMVPKVPFNHRRVPMNMPEEIWITDTSLRDGQQSVEPYTVDQIVNIYKYLSRLGGPYGIIRQTEFFIYSKKDREALEKCMELGLKFPEITTWIRATKEDFRLVRDLGIRETGILVSCSDYHIFKKMKMTRKQAMDYYLATVADAFEAGVVPRCHLEDITRADFYGFVVPFVNELQKLSRQAGIPVKIRACDTMGYGIPYTEAALPRSVAGIIYGLQQYSDVPSECLEWHGHNDFYKAVVNASTAWLYGACAVNCSLLGIGERTGNIPLEAMVFEYASLRGSLDGMDPTVITDSEIEEIQAWANAQYERASEIADIDTLPDVISFGETIVIKGVDGGKASLSIGDNQISPDEGSEEVIDICFSNGDENTTSGYIKLTVGYLNFDEDGGAADGISDEVEYEYHDILKELDNFIYAQNCLIEKDTRIAEIISEAIKTNGDNT